MHACLCVRARVQHADNVRLVTHVCRCDRHERWSRWLRHGRFRLVVRSSLSVRILSSSLFPSQPLVPCFSFSLTPLCAHPVTFALVRRHIQGSPSSISSVTSLLPLHIPDKPPIFSLCNWFTVIVHPRQSFRQFLYWPGLTRFARFQRFLVTRFHGSEVEFDRCWLNFVDS